MTYWAMWFGGGAGLVVATVMGLFKAFPADHPQFESPTPHSLVFPRVQRVLVSLWLFTMLAVSVGMFLRAFWPTLRQQLFSLFVGG